MYKQKDLLRVLKKNLKLELANIKFYSTNIEKINPVENKKLIETLVLGSIEHAKKISKLIISSAESKTKLTKAVKDSVIKEETGLKEIYKYELSRTNNPKVQKLLEELIKEETEHEKIVQKFK